jgi:hypothetical protein
MAFFLIWQEILVERQLSPCNYEIGVATLSSISPSYRALAKRGEPEPVTHLSLII